MQTDFYTTLEERGYQNLLRRVEYKPQLFHNYNKMREVFREIMENPNCKILIIGDYDVDGLMYVLETREFLKTLGCDNYVVFPYWRRTHELDKEAVRYCIQNDFDYVLIGDTASSDLATLEEITKYGIKVVVIDHHVCDHSYDDYAEDVTIINSYIENQIEQCNKYAYSAAALAYVIYDYFAQEHMLCYNNSISAYALISLYSDCMDMSNELNRAIYYRACYMEREKLPAFVLHFLNEYQAFNARFIGFWYAPRINALFRGENFALLNEYFFDESITVDRKARCIEAINEAFDALFR